MIQTLCKTIKSVTFGMIYKSHVFSMEVFLNELRSMWTKSLTEDAF